MKKLVISLENPLDKINHDFSVVFKNHADADDTADWLSIILPRLLDLSIALYTNVKVYTTPYFPTASELTGDIDTVLVDNIAAAQKERKEVKEVKENDNSESK